MGVCIGNPHHLLGVVSLLPTFLLTEKEKAAIFKETGNSTFPAHFFQEYEVGINKRGTEGGY